MYIVAILLIIGVIGFGYLASNSNDEVVKDEVVEENIALPDKKDDTEVPATTTEQVPPVVNSTNTDSVVAKKETPAKPTNTTPAPTPATPKPEPVETPILAKSYTAEKIYFVSNNKYTIDVTLEVTDGIITDADVMYGNKSTGFEHPLQESFDRKYSSLVIGKKLEDISLSRVGGASITSKAFNQAVQDIIKQI